MNAMNSALRKLLFALALLASGATPSFAADAKAASDKPSAGDEEDKPEEQRRTKTLEDRVAPVSGRLFVRKGRHELSPTFGFSLDDAFFRKYLFGLRYAYHPLESLSVGIGGTFGISTPSGAVAVCRAETGCAAPTKDLLTRTPGDISALAGLDVAWAPLYGKLNFAGEKVFHQDLYLLGGAGIVRYGDPSADGAQTITFGGHFGIGTHLMLNEWFALRLEARDHIYSGKRTVNGEVVGTVENQLLVGLGGSFFFPLSSGSNP